MNVAPNYYQLIIDQLISNDNYGPEWPSVRSSLRPFVTLTGSSLCSLLLRNYSTDFSNDDTNQLREQCRCATCTSF